MPATSPEAKARKADWWREKYATDPQFRERHLARELSPEQVARNAARRQRRYQNDPDFRSREQERQRLLQPKKRHLSPEAKARRTARRAARRRDRMRDDPVYRERQLEKKRAMRERNRESHRAAHVRRTYGLTLEAYQELLDFADGCCHLCGSPPSAKRQLAVDHDHACCPGKTSCGRCVRGLLCVGCNLGLGALEPKVDLTTLAEYATRRPLDQEGAA